MSWSLVMRPMSFSSSAFSINAVNILFATGLLASEKSYMCRRPKASSAPDWRVRSTTGLRTSSAAVCGTSLPKVSAHFSFGVDQGRQCALQSSCAIGKLCSAYTCSISASRCLKYTNAASDVRRAWSLASSWPSDGFGRSMLGEHFGYTNARRGKAPCCVTSSSCALANVSVPFAAARFSAASFASACACCAASWLSCGWLSAFCAAVLASAAALAACSAVATAFAAASIFSASACSMS